MPPTYVIESFPASTPVTLAFLVVCISLSFSQTIAHPAGVSGPALFYTNKA